MTTPEANVRWEETLAHLRDDLPEFSYRAWIAPLKLVSAENGCVLLSAAELFSASNLRKRYLSLLNAAVQLTFGREYTVEITYPGEQRGDPPAGRSQRPRLNPRYTFETFVVGSNNRYAHAAAAAVAELPAKAYNPLFLYGGVGLGKTHLMHAIGHQVLRDDPDVKLLYLTSEEFTNKVITAISKKTNEELRQSLRGVDILMVDDIQFIAGKPSTQEEFFHTFNQLYEMDKQIVISSDRHPSEIPTLEERLRSRFVWGLVADIQKPDYETRMAILTQKANEEHCVVGEDVIAFIAENVQSNIRELEGALNRVNALAELTHTEPTLETAREALSSLIPIRDPRRITADLIISVVCGHFGVTPEDMSSSRRSREISCPRQIAMFLCREMTDLSTTRIGAAFGNRDHTTVMHACEKVSADMEDADTRRTVELLRQKIREA